VNVGIKGKFAQFVGGVAAFFKDERADIESDLDYSLAPAKRTGLIIVFLCFGAFGSWSLLAPIAGAAVAPGVMVVGSYRQTVQHLEGGIVSEIRVRDGQEVKKGETLLTLETTQSQAQLGMAKSQYYVSAATKARLIAERDNLSTVNYPLEKLPATAPEAVEAIHAQNQIFNARQLAHDGERQVLKQRVDQLHAQGEGLKELQKSKKALAESFAEEIEEFEELFKEGFADKVRLRDLKRNAVRLDGEISENFSAIARVGIQVGETELQLLQLGKDLQTQVAGELGVTQSQLFDLEEQIRALADRVNRTDIVSPSDGIVLGMTVHTIGAVIPAGQAILDVVPQSQELVIEAQVSPADIDRVQQGQEAVVRFSIFSKTPPELIGHVESLSADRIIDQNSGNAYFLARVSIPEAEMVKLAGEELQPGMPADVFIQSGSRTLFQYLMKPINNAFARSLTED